MKRAGPIGESSSSRRAQPVRQARTNPARSSLARNATRDTLDDDAGGDQTEIFPAVTHFTDTIAALPRELVRHFTLLKEVDAKVFAPEEALVQLVQTTSKYPVPKRIQDAALKVIAGQAAADGSNEHNTAVASASGSLVNGQTGTASIASMASSLDAADAESLVYDPENLTRRQLFRQVAYTMQEMLMSLDEKNHVISTANEAMSKQLSRLNNVYPYVKGEVSDEVLWGSNTHWAYPDNRLPKDHGKELGRPTGKGGVNHLANAAAQAAAEEAAARSEARKQAVAAKKGRGAHGGDKHGVNDSEFEEGAGKKSRKGKNADAGPSGANGKDGPLSKRRKVEKGPGGEAMQRSASGVKGKAGAAASPRGTPVPEAKKRSKNAAGPNGLPKKRLVCLTFDFLNCVVYLWMGSANFCPVETQPPQPQPPPPPLAHPSSAHSTSPHPPAHHPPSLRHPVHDRTAHKAADRPSSVRLHQPQIALMVQPRPIWRPSQMLRDAVYQTSRHISRKQLRTTRNTSWKNLALVTRRYAVVCWSATPMPAKIRRA
jgi:hypothetical protein